MVKEVERPCGAMSKEQFAASLVRILRQGTRIATGEEETAGSAREFMDRLRAEVEGDKREGRQD